MAILSYKPQVLSIVEDTINIIGLACYGKLESRFNLISFLFCSFYFSDKQLHTHTHATQVPSQ